MRHWFVYQLDGNYIGPVTSEQLARGVIAGKVPRDAHVASPGDSEWLGVLTVPEIAAEVRRLESTREPVGARPIQSVPPAPPPRPQDSGRVMDFAGLVQNPPRIGLAGEPSPRPADPFPIPATTAPAAEPKKEEKKEEKPPFKLDPKYRVIPYGIFGACCVVAAIVAVVALTRGPEAPAAGAETPAAAPKK